MSGVLTVGSGIEHAHGRQPGIHPGGHRADGGHPRGPPQRALVDRRPRCAPSPTTSTTPRRPRRRRRLILGAQRRGPGLAAVLDDLAATVAEEVRIRRGIEADRAKPRTTARWVTILTLAVLGLLALDRDLHRAVQDAARPARAARVPRPVRRLPAVAARDDPRRAYPPVPPAPRRAPGGADEPTHRRGAAARRARRRSG